VETLPPTESHIPLGIFHKKAFDYVLPLAHPKRNEKTQVAWCFLLRFIARGKFFNHALSQAFSSVTTLKCLGSG
jgi:hypothetical protein